MNRFAFSAVLLSGIAALTAVPAAAQVPSNVSWVRVVHAAADAPAVDILANGNIVFENLKFKNFTEYTPVPPGSYSFSINLTGTSTTAYTNTPATLEGGRAYTFYALGRVSNGSLHIMGTGDDATPAPAGQAKVRVVHGASLAPAVDVYATTPYAPLGSAAPALTSVPFALASHYLTVPAGAYQGRVAVAGTKTVAIDSGRLVLMGGTTRTIVAIDPVMAGGAFELLVLPDLN
ncbi:hypothetical protein F183_A41160 [Bryobacterales bacterium F-183]|nr:hypothetical protein F183_A41160 [Bryobacterales bacterium F-183]